MTMALDLDAELAAYEAQACTGKRPFGAKGARNVAEQMRVRENHATPVSPYPCPFCDAWHVGHALGMANLVRIAALLRARSGNAPSEPGSGTTRRQRRKQRGVNPPTVGLTP